MMLEPRGDFIAPQPTSDAPPAQEAMSPTAHSGPEYEAFIRGLRMGEAGLKEIRSALNAEIDRFQRALSEAARALGRDRGKRNETIAQRITALRKQRDSLRRETQRLLSMMPDKESVLIPVATLNDLRREREKYGPWDRESYKQGFEAAVRNKEGSSH
jgi:DNA-binding transcriptional MerR regulator